MSCVDSVSRSPVDNSTALNSQKAPSFAAELQAAQVKVSQSQTADITIVTREGDTVTLSSSKSAESSFSTYDAQGQVGAASASISGMTAELHRSTSFSISFEGDLNKEELMDIRRALRTFQQAAHDVLTGHAEKAASRTAKLANLDQIASIEADLEFNREVSVTQASVQSETAPIPPSAGTPGPTPASNPQQTEPASDTVTTAQAGTAKVPPAASGATGTAATDSRHISVLIQIETGAISANMPDASRSGRWWLPSPDPWTILHPKKDSVTPAAPVADSAPPVTA